MQQGLGTYTELFFAGRVILILLAIVEVLTVRGRRALSHEKRKGAGRKARSGIGSLLAIKQTNDQINADFAI